MSNAVSPILSRFDNEPCLVNSERTSWFQTCIAGAEATQRELVAANAESPVTMGDDFWYPADDWRAAYRPYTVKDGILQIPIKGVLLHDYGFAAPWATGYDYIWRAFERGMGDLNVNGIALICDTPGGMVAGNFDLVDKMWALKGMKPVRGFAHESAYSAGYSIISVADEIVVSRTGGVGSIGVVTMHVDQSKLMSDIGVKVTFIHAGKHKVDGNPYEALPADVKARIQERIDALYAIFVSTVARNRGLDEAIIRATEALTFTAEEAVSNKLADSIGSLDDAVAAFAAKLSKDAGDEQMLTAEQEAAALAAQNTAIANARAEGVTEGTALGTAAERVRISAIMGAEEAATRPAAALNIALTTDLTVEQASGLLKTLPEAATAPPPAPAADESATGQDFNAAMAAGKPDLGGGSDTGQAADPDDATASLDFARAYGLGGLKAAAK